jgi:regulator of protease activity HflC (stomatin/prohibitin superfamily)
METAFYVLPVLILGLFILSSSVKILREYERAVVFRLGRLVPNKGQRPGIILLIPFVDKMVKVSLRTVAMDVAPQDVITRDNVSIKVNAVIFFRVIDPRQAVVQVEDYLYATSQIAQTTLRSVLGQPAAPADHRPAHGSVGREGDRRRGQARRPPAGHAARDVEAGGGGARAAREDHQRGG